MERVVELQEGTAEQQGYHPEVQFDYAPTPPFAQAFPEEAPQQGAKFSAPSWVQQVRPAGEPPVVPPQVRKPPPQVQSFNPVAVFGIGFALFAAGYLLWQWIAPTNSGGATSTLPSTSMPEPPPMYGVRVPQ